ncbi:MAG: GerMN domain-containing protein [Candidatus Paceibacterota bacterium]|jgi:spore germination protein GerM
MKKSTIAILIAAVLVILGILVFRDDTMEQEPVDNTPANNIANNNNEVSQISQVKIALLDTAGGSGKQRGCDTVVMVARQIAPTGAPLTAALRELFALDQNMVGDLYHFIANTNDTLAFDRATVENGIAKIYLTGRLSGLAGVCDNPRAAIQIEETALQFATVSSVEIYLNGAKTVLTPNEM